jgi:hypothetical protein
VGRGRRMASARARRPESRLESRLESRRMRTRPAAQEIQSCRRPYVAKKMADARPRGAADVVTDVVTDARPRGAAASAAME